MKNEADYFENIVPVGQVPAYRPGIIVKSIGNNQYAIWTGGMQLSLNKVEPYFIAGRVAERKCWLIHIAVIAQQFDAFFSRIIDFLAGLATAFSFPVNVEQHRRILDGRTGLMNVGKVITIQLNDEVRADEVLAFLIAHSTELKSPAVAGSLQVSNCIYVSHGTFLAIPELSIRGVSLDYGSKAVLDLQHRLRKGRLVWPFKKYAAIPWQPHRHLLHGRYLPVTTLKVDPKGSVFKAIKLNRLYNLQWCVLKQGNRHHCHDDDGRDIIDRLRWQFRVHQELRDLLPLPQAQELFMEDEKAYLVLAYIEGQSLSEWITLAYSGRNWSSLDESECFALLLALEQLIQILTILHDQGFIHRDLNPENFMVTPAGKLYLTDFELCYSSANHLPAPPFALGTRGYMSPQQQCGASPVPADDIYALGGMLIKFFTGLSPLKFNAANAETLNTQLSFFIPDSKLCQLICDCLQASPDSRPALKEIQASLSLFQSKLVLKIIPENIKECEPLRFPVRFDLAWELQRLQTDAVLMEIDGSGGIGHDLANGKAGLQYTVAHLELPGLFEDSGTDGTRLTSGYDLKYSGFASGLFYGSEGMAFSLAEAMQAGQGLRKDWSRDDWSHLLLREPLELPGIAEGCSGQGLALMKCLQVWNSEAGDQLLRTIVARLLGQQRRDGSWIIKQAEDSVKGMKLPGLFHGVAGIAWFLMRYAERYQDTLATAAARSALNYLMGQKSAQNGYPVWTLNPHISAVDPWLEDGFTGIAFLFIRAYACFGDERYKQVATGALLAHPAYISSNFLSLSNGLAGLGEVYLEAYALFGEQRWKTRAGWIAEFFYHTGYADGRHYWDRDESGDYQKGLLNGQAGILHFLQRCKHPQKINFPIFS